MACGVNRGEVRGQALARQKERLELFVPERHREFLLRYPVESISEPNLRAKACRPRAPSPVQKLPTFRRHGGTEKHQVVYVLSNLFPEAKGLQPSQASLGIRQALSNFGQLFRKNRKGDYLLTKEQRTEFGNF